MVSLRFVKKYKITPTNYELNPEQNTALSQIRHKSTKIASIFTLNPKIKYTFNSP